MTPGPAPFPALFPAAPRDDRAFAALFALLVFLGIVAAAFGLGIAGSARLLDRPGTRLTVQVPATAGARALDLLRTAPGVVRATPVDPATLRRLLRPWLGEDAADLPIAAMIPAMIPAMIDVDLDDAAALPAIEARLRGAVAVIRIDRADRWLAPVATLLRRLRWAAAVLVLLPVVATPLLAARAARHRLARQGEAIRLVRALGATDRQLAAPFRRRITGAVLAGAGVGALAATAIVVPVDAAVAALGSDLIAAAALPPSGWVMLAAMPVVLAALAIAAAMRATTTMLGRLA
jgi:cell division transport system permease protein